MFKRENRNGAARLRHIENNGSIGLQGKAALHVAPMRSLLFAGLTGALLLSTSHAENLLDNASFELPKISGRTTAAKGGSPSQTEEKTSWTSFSGEYEGKDGKLISGMTDEIAHTGKQSLFIDFDKLAAPNKRAVLVSELLPIVPGRPYTISLWGRIDRKRPISMDTRRPHLLVEVEYFSPDQETQVGDTEYRIQMIPGSNVAGLGTRLLFVSGKWNEYSTDVTSPVDAGFMKVTFYFQTPKEEGETDGIIYLDDAIVEGERGSDPVTPPEDDTSAEEDAQKTVPAPSAPPAAPPAAPASKGGSPAKTAPAKK